MERTIILGGHGKVALLTERLLADKGILSSAIIRQAAQEPTVEAAGTSPVLFNLEEASLDDMTQMFAGAQTLVRSAGAGGGSAERTYAVDRDAAIRSMDAVLAAHVQRYIMVSYWDAPHGYDKISETDSFYAYARAKADADAHLRASQLNWTILGPTRLTNETATGRITLGGQDKQTGLRNATSRGNVAQAIVAVMQDPTSIGKPIDFYDGDTPIEEALHSA